MREVRVLEGFCQIELNGVCRKRERRELPNLDLIENDHVSLGKGFYNLATFGKL